MNTVAKHGAANKITQKPAARKVSPRSEGSDVSDVEHIRHAAQRELELARQTRLAAERYQQETETRARSQAQLLILQARLDTQKEIAGLKQKASEEIQKVLADIRMIRITAQEELETQRKFTNAARIQALSLEYADLCRRAESKKQAVNA
ncbi:MAG: hypothetical protein PHR56_08805 [Dehalococcoidales bacterium]|nr:hypothetical protein [Dehalococcoidales bacterium]